MREPIARQDILVPQDYLGNVITLCVEKRGAARYAALGAQVSLTYDIQLSEVVLDLFDWLKSASRRLRLAGLRPERFETANLVRPDVLINGERVDAWR